MFRASFTAVANEVALALSVASAISPTNSDSTAEFVISSSVKRLPPLAALEANMLEMAFIAVDKSVSSTEDPPETIDARACCRVYKPC